MHANLEFNQSNKYRSQHNHWVTELQLNQRFEVEKLNDLMHFHKRETDAKMRHLDFVIYKYIKGVN